MTQAHRASHHATTITTLRILEQTYPGWDIRQRGSMWSAVRLTAPTAEQATAGLHQFIVQPTLEALSAVLAQQLAIAQHMRRFL